MIRRIKFPGKTLSSPAKLNPVEKKNFHRLQCFSLFHIETSHLICKSNQLTGFYMILVFTESCFRTDYKLPWFFSSFFLYFDIAYFIVYKSISAVVVWVLNIRIIQLTIQILIWYFIFQVIIKKCKACQFFPTPIRTPMWT